MRALEFITEYGQLKTQRTHRDGLDLEVRTSNNNMSIYAYDRGGRELAHVHFDIKPYVSDVERKKIVVPYDLEVGSEYRGQGIAAVMYDYAKDLGYEVQRSSEQTDAGEHFWDKNRGQGAKIWESKTLDPDLYGEMLPTATVRKIVTSAVKQVDPNAQVTVKQSPEGYYICRSEGLRLDFGITADGGDINANIVNAYSSYPGAGLVTRIFAECFKAAEQLWGKPNKFAMSAHEDRGHGVWQHIAQKLGAEWEGSISENFADGKVKGKSRPGRVKKAGASCSGSVTSLRAKAKKYGGEKGKMYHWCANMKGGKNESELEEGWKDTLAGVATAGALALGSPATADAANSGPAHKPTIQQQAQMSPVEKLKLAANANGIKGTELAQFLAQCAHESANFTRMEEIGGPAYFAKKYDPKYAPKTAKILGNTEIGDGERYKGRGFIQLTGRENYRRAGRALNLPLEANPDLAARPDVAAMVAVWYWKSRVANKVKNFHNTKQVTKAINPATKGLDQRKEKFKQYQLAMR